MPHVCFLNCEPSIKCGDNADSKSSNAVLRSYVNLMKTTCDELSLNFAEIKLDENNLETLYLAKLAVILITPKEDNHYKNSIFYHLGVRSNCTGSNHNLILYHSSDTKLNEMLKLPVFADLTMALCYNLEVCKQVPSDSGLLGKPNEVSFADYISYLLKKIDTPPICELSETFTKEIEKLCRGSNGNNTKEAVDNLKARLRQPGIFSQKTFLGLLNAFRDIQAYTSVIELVDEWSEVKLVKEDPLVSYHYAFALNRRNEKGDRDKALTVVVQLLNDEKNHSSENLCLCGRIYKDKFIESRYTSLHDLEQAILWYRKGNTTKMNIHAGINLLTLLVVSGEKQFETSTELLSLSLMLNNMLGRKGKLEHLVDYWDVATLFELSVLLENYDRAVIAAHRMLFLKPPKWCIKSTLGNIFLIKDFLKKKDETDQTPAERLLNIWVEYLSVYCGVGEEIKDSAAFNVLMVRNKERSAMTNIAFDLENKIISIWPWNDKENTIMYPASAIGGICLCRRDDYCAVLCVTEGCIDFELIFASSSLRQRFRQMIHKITDRNIT